MDELAKLELHEKLDAIRDGQKRIAKKLDAILAAVGADRGDAGEDTDAVGEDAARS